MHDVPFLFQALLGGMVSDNVDEEPLDAAKRELLEEMGLESEAGDWTALGSVSSF